MTEANPTPDPATTAAPVATGYDGPAPTKDESNMSMLMFILAILTGFLGPLILWLVKRNESKYLDAQGKEVMNYIITTVLVIIVSIPLMFILVGFLLYFAAIICYVVFNIIGAVKSSKGVFYRYPYALRLLK